jgi:hypothetical protein
MSSRGYKHIAVSAHAGAAWLLWLSVATLGNGQAWGAERLADNGLAVPYRFGDVQRWAPVFERPQRDRYHLKHLQRKLKPGGRIAIIDWRKQPLPRGPEPRWKLTAAQVTDETSRAGLCTLNRPEFLPYQYFFILQACSGKQGDRVTTLPP